MSSSGERAPATLAVVIPAYNAEATLRDCLTAVSRSERKPDEIIVSNDGSTDQTAEIARAAGVIVLTHGGRAQGPAVARNIAAAEARSDIIAFVDADVAVSPQALGRLEAPLLTGEAVASFGLIATILGCRRFRPSLVPGAVALYVVAGYWFTASTCFANPAVAIARSLTDTFAGIRPIDVPWFIGAEIVGAILAAVLFRWLLRETSQSGDVPDAAPTRLAK